MDYHGIRDVSSPTGSAALKVDQIIENIHNELNLEETVLRQRAREIKNETIKLARQRAFLRAERRRARLDSEAVIFHKEQLEKMQKNGWFPKDYLLQNNNKKIKFNVGGQVFQVSYHVLNKDPGSLLASLASESCPLSMRQDGLIYFDRDWWLFRYILIFLRDGLLPDDRGTLSQLYREGCFWKLESLRKAIEETQLHLQRRNLIIDEKGQIKDKVLKPEETPAAPWWKSAPGWYAAPPASISNATPVTLMVNTSLPSPSPSSQGASTTLTATASATTAPPPPKPDWWKDSKWNGKDFGILSNDPMKVTTESAAPDAIPMLKTTWMRPIQVATNPGSKPLI